jgi:uncharacterized GH25 family protein
MCRFFQGIVLCFVLWFGGSVTAQEFWMTPKKFRYSKGDTLKLKFNVGNNFTGETWNLRTERIQSITGFSNNQPTDLTTEVLPGTNDHLKIPMTTEGSYIVAMEGKSAFVELGAERFNAYLKENALDDVINQRRKNNTTNQPGKEFYIRNAKLIVQVGNKLDDGFKKRTGLTLDIIPQTNPSSYKVGDMVKFTILYNGKPLFGARAFSMNNKENRVYAQPIYTQQDGSIEVRIFNDGLWMITVVTMVPSKDKGADWQSYWGTLVFEVK